MKYADATSQSAEVDSNGWLTSVTNEVGAKTCYTYDAMGRLASITYPSESQTDTRDIFRVGGDQPQLRARRQHRVRYRRGPLARDHHHRECDQDQLLRRLVASAADPRATRPTWPAPSASASGPMTPKVGRCLPPIPRPPAHRDHRYMDQLR